MGKTMKVYFIPGLAADGRVFHRVRLPKGFEPVFLDWLDPREGESLRQYAARMADCIDTSSPFSILGLSFGGMLASEIARVHRPEKVILVSSIPQARHLPSYFRMAGKLKLDAAVPVGMLKQGIITRRIFSRNGSEDSAIIRDIVEKSDARFIRWAMRAILDWDGGPPDRHFYQIHGTNDIVLPLRYTRPTHVVRGAGHLMIMDRAEEINRLLAEILDS